MFKNIQHKLLLRYPLLWNTRIVPVAAVGLLLNIIFFVMGYIHGYVDFGIENTSFYVDATPAIIAMLSGVLGILVTIVWGVYYLRNNSFKSIYPRSKSSLFKEWLIILLAFMLNCSYSLSFLYGFDVRGRGYFAEEEFSHRLDVISMASVFADGGFQDNGEYGTQVNGEYITKYRNYMTYGGQRYPLNSLFNKATTDFSYQDGKKDSVNEMRVKNWLQENRKDSVLWVMREFDKIAKEHHASTNLTPEKWLGLVYSYPKFSDYITVGRQERYEWYDMRLHYGEIPDVPIGFTDPEGINNTNKVDYKSNTVKVIDSIVYIYPKNFVPLNHLDQPYARISDAYVHPKADVAIFFAYLYTALGFSVVLFSFRVTSGRAWLIALVAFGVTALITGILNFLVMDVMFYSSLQRFDVVTYFSIWTIIVIGLIIYFLTKKRSKGKSEIVLNIILWLSPALLPTMLLVTNEIAEYITEQRVRYDPAQHTYRQSGYERFIQNNPELLAGLCFVSFVIFMYFFTNAIKRWKGLAES